MLYSMKDINFNELLIYLRKSRQDDPNETVEEVLAKHEIQLQEYAERELGGRIPEENIYREVVSGESIDSRIEIQKVLARIEDPKIRGVLVVEPSRLSRGDLGDCDRMIKGFQLSHTLVITPMMTYDLDKKLERKFFQDELLRGRDFYEYTRDILFMGRVRAAKRGCYNARYAPYGYKKVKLGKDHTLEILEEEAEVVRLIFDMYTKEHVGPGRIADRLNGMGIPAPKGEKWVKPSIRGILRNEHYNGKIVFNRRKRTPVLENGEIVVKRLAQPDEDVIIAEGKHPAIIDNDQWKAAQELVARNPREKHTYDLKNPYSGVMHCAKCGKIMYQHPYSHTVDRYECRTRPRCYKSIKVTAIDEAVLVALEESELPELQMRLKNNDGDAVKIQKRLLQKLEKQMTEYREQEEKQYELLETGKYSQDLFDRRNAALRTKMEDCQAQIYAAKKSMPESVDYAERIAKLQDAIAMLKDPEATPAEKNKALKVIVDRIDFTGSPSDKQNKKRQTNTGVDPFSIAVTLRL